MFSFLTCRAFPLRVFFPLQSGCTAILPHNRFHLLLSDGQFQWYVLHLHYLTENIVVNMDCYSIEFGHVFT